MNKIPYFLDPFSWWWTFGLLASLEIVLWTFFLHAFWWAFKIFKIHLFYLFKRQRHGEGKDRERYEREREKPTIHWFIPHMSTKARNWELSPVLPCTFQGSSYWSHYLLLPRFFPGPGSWNREQSWDSNPYLIQIWSVGIQSSNLMNVPDGDELMYTQMFDMYLQVELLIKGDGYVWL